MNSMPHLVTCLQRLLTGTSYKIVFLKKVLILGILKTPLVQVYQGLHLYFICFDNEGTRSKV